MKSKSLKHPTVDCSDSEKAYRRKLFDDVSKVMNKRLNCTCCSNDVKNDVLLKDKVYIHPFFQVLVCRECLKFYGDGYISPDEDGSDKYCRWCGQGGCLNVCSDCPVAICKSCVQRNLSRTDREDLKKDDWKCYSCNPQPLYEIRALAWALKSWLKSKKKPKKEKEEAKPNDNSLEGHLRNGLDYELAMIKEIQKLCRSCEMKVGGIGRRKDLVNKQNLSFEKIHNASKEIVSQISAASDKLKEFEQDITNYFKDLEPLIQKLHSENTEEMTDPIEISDNEESSVKSSKKRSHSTDSEESKSKKQKENSKNRVNKEKNTSEKQLTDEDSNSSSLKIATTDSNGVTNGEGNINSPDNLSENETACSKDTDENTSIYETVTSDSKGKEKEGHIPKLTLRIRKVEEVNKVLEEDANHVTEEPEVINLDDGDDDEVSERENETELNINETEENVKPEIIDETVEEDAASDITLPVIEDESVQVISKESDDSDTVLKESSVAMDSKKKPVTQESSVDSTVKVTQNNKERSTKRTERRKSSADKEKSAAQKKKVVRKESEENMEIGSNVSGDIFSEDEYDRTVVTQVISSTSSEDSVVTSKSTKSAEKKPVRKSRGARNAAKNVKNSDVSDADSDIEKLLNTENIDKKRRKAVKVEEEKTGAEKTKAVGSKKPKTETILDYCADDSDESVIDLVAELNAVRKKDRLDRQTIWKMLKNDTYLNLKPTSLSPESSDEEVAERSDNSEDLLLDSDEEKRKKKNSLKSDRKDKEGENSDSDDSEDGKDSKSAKWRSDKLLTMKLSDDSDSDVFQKKSAKKDNKRNKKKAAILSDSDEGKDEKTKKKNSSESVDDSDDDDSEEDQTPKKRRRIKNASSSSGDENAVEGSGGKGHRKNIRKVLKKDSLQEKTQNALKEEEDRKKRIAERQKLYNQLMQECEVVSSKVDKLVLDFDVESKKELLSVDKDLVAKLKPHQAEGIKFMWDSCFETLKKAKKNKGSGCILAHCMGLGKTLQIVTLLHTLLTNETGVKCALVLCPLSTVLNWVSEFDKWLSDIGSGEDVEVFHMTKVNAQHRATQLREWKRRGGVMVLAYNLFRLLINPTKRIKAALKTAYVETLSDPGPDIVICDEGHLLKNEKTALSKAVEKITSLRRIVLTGTPLQNNLVEYHCMMQFVKPSLLGTKKEFTNRFVNPIENGQFVDSTPHDVKIMKRRAHVLHKMLDGLVQRKAYNVLVPFLPVKHEYVLSLSLTEVQVELYRHYLENFARNKVSSGVGTSLFKDRNMLSLICAHPRLLMVHDENELMKKEFEESSDEEGSLKDFIHDSSSESSTSEESSDDNSQSSGSVKMVSRRKTRNAPEEEKIEEPEEEPKNENWWSNIVKEGDMDDIGASSKLLLFFTILQKCEEIGDKLLVFSQSLLLLDLIEYFLDKIDSQSNSEEVPEGLRGFSGSWARGIDYFRLDGKTSSDNRANWCNRFNSDSNLRSRLFLISTRAGGLGINLTGANRVILFDASWNPSHDVQSIFRVYRFGQTKPCYIYRFLNKGTMEQKVYDRQVAKLSMSCRVIDEQQIDRHFSYADLNELYTFTPNEKDDKTLPLPKDRLLAEILQERKDLVLWYHTHDSLLENQENEELNEEERKQAWADFENEKNPPPNEFMSNYAETYQRVYNTLKGKYTTWTESDVRQAALTVMSKMNTMSGGNQPYTSQQLSQQQYILMHQIRTANMQAQQQMLQQQQAHGFQSMPRGFSGNQGMNSLGNKFSMTQGMLPPVRNYSTINLPLNNPNLANITQMYNNTRPNLIQNPLNVLKLPNPFNQSIQSIMTQGAINPATATPNQNQPEPGTSSSQLKK